MDGSDSYAISLAAAKQISSLKVYRDEQDREVLIASGEGTEIAISMEVRSVTSAVLYRPTGAVPEALERYDETPSEASGFGAIIRAD